ncbi:MULTISPECIES: hypothetical protein [Streptomyces]|uniref:DUF3618 domain-containing protein n=1 Tax=Streptomyces alboflavus TaxID=67267 RepID=A0A1Z1WQD5_9ACTN|nr:hypothetical protein [Streptomyces alboflavus]ARX88599.1 hypothetical protein SMD44_08086 [Streptomyces alboflavus]
MTRRTHHSKSPAAPERLRKHAEETKQGLGRTVDALAAATTDVKAKAAHTTDQAKVMASQAGDRLQEQTPELLRQKAGQGAEAARNNRGLLLATAVGVTALWLVFRRKEK